MKTIILFFLLAITINAQSEFMLLMNDAATSGNAFITDGLEYYGNIDSVNTGSVEVWEDEITGMNAIIVGGDTTLRPIRAGDDVLFAAGDWLRSDSATKAFTGAMSIEIVGEFSDSGATEIITVRTSNKLLSMSFHGERFCISAWAGGDVFNYNVYSDTVMGRHHIVATWDGVNESGITMYVDNVEVPTIGNAFGLFGGEAYVYLGNTGGTDPFSLPLWRVYSSELTTGVTTNYNSNSVRDLIP